MQVLILDTVDKNQFAVEFFETLIEKMMQGGQKPLGLHLLMGRAQKTKCECLQAI